MAREVFVSLDGGPARSYRLALSGHGAIAPGTTTRGRLLYPFGRPRLVDPGDWIEMEILGRDTKAVGNAAVYRAARRDAAAPEGVPGA
jgi:hypothetical protein